MALIKVIIPAFLLTIYAPFFFPAYKLFFFAPLIIRLFYLRSYHETLWASCLLGIVIDLLSSHVRFGLYALNFTLTSALLYSQRRNFFEDSYSTLPVLTSIYSFVSTIVQILLLTVFENGVAFSWDFVKIDLFLLPILDGLYAFVCFSLPELVFGKPRRKGKDYFCRTTMEYHPLAEQLRPKSLDEIVGQEHLVGPKGFYHAHRQREKTAFISALWTAGHR